MGLNKSKLLKALKNHDTSQAIEILKSHPSLSKAIINGKPLLFMAIANENVELTEHIIAAGGYTHWQGVTPLQVAFDARSRKIALLLLEAGAEWDNPFLLHLATEYRWHDVIPKIKKNPDWHIGDFRPAIYTAVENDDRACILTLLNMGASIEGIDEPSPLAYAIIKCKVNADANFRLNGLV